MGAFRPSCAAHLCRTFGQRRALVLDAAQFRHITDAVSETSKHYAGSVLALLSENRRGHVLQEVCKRALAEAYPTSKIEEASPSSVCVDGRRTQWDFTLDGQKVECKSAQLAWSIAQKRWRVAFHNIKLAWPGLRTHAPFDSLYLTMLRETPVGSQRDLTFWQNCSAATLLVPWCLTSTCQIQDMQASFLSS